MKLEVGHLQITELIRYIQSGKLALPEFQRDFVWRPVDVVDLLCSVARQWPIGSFLVMESKEKPFELRALEQGPQLSSEIELIVLDGQQRCTSFFHAFTDNSPDVTFFLQFPVAWDEFDEEQIRFEKKAKFARRFPTMESMAAERVIRISDLHDDSRFEEWKEHLADRGARMAAVSFRATQIAGLKDLTIPVSKLSGEPDLRAIAKIFETINRTGRRLDTFDLLVARLYPYDFKLRDRWEDASAAIPSLDRFGVDGLEILKLIALRRWWAEVSRGLSPTIKGIRQSDVLMLDADTVKNDWDTALVAYSQALDFLERSGGVICSGLMPQPSLPLTIAFFLASDQHNRHGFLDDFERWYWASVFKQTYAQGANTQVLADVKALSAWNASEAAVPEVVSTFAIGDDQLSEGRRLNEMLVRGLLGRQIRLGARDWSLAGTAMKVSVAAEIHHIFPTDVLEALPPGHSIPRDPILNFAAILPATNKMIRNEHPNTVIQRADINRTAVETHGIDPVWLAPTAGESQRDLVRRFLGERLAVARRLIEDAVAGR